MRREVVDREMHKSIRSYDEEYIAQQFTDNVLRGIPFRSFLREREGQYGIRFVSSLPYVDAVLLFLPQEVVHSQFDMRLVDSTAICDVVLSAKEYLAIYAMDDGREYRHVVHRDVLTHMYYAAYPERVASTHDLLSVPFSALGSYTNAHGMRNIVFRSVKIKTGAFLSFNVRERDLHWLPHRENVGGIVRETGVLEPFVHIDLIEQVYKVTYKTAETQWKNREMIVTRETLASDYLMSNRAAYADVSASKYLTWWRQEVPAQLFDVKNMDCIL